MYEHAALEDVEETAGCAEKGTWGEGQQPPVRRAGEPGSVHPSPLPTQVLDSMEAAEQVPSPLDAVCPRAGGGSEAYDSGAESGSDSEEGVPRDFRRRACDVECALNFRHLPPAHQARAVGVLGSFPGFELQ